MKESITLETSIVELLRARGPMTSAEIANELCAPYPSVRACIGNARNSKRRLFYIIDFDDVAGRGYKRPAIYAIGNRKDASYPHLGLGQKYKRKWQRVKTERLIREAGCSNPFAALIVQVTR